MDERIDGNDNLPLRVLKLKKKNDEIFFSSFSYHDDNKKQNWK